MLIMFYFQAFNARGTACVGGRRATWKNPALSFRVIGQVHASRHAVISGGHEEAEAAGM